LKGLKGMWWRRAADSPSTLLGDKKEICCLFSKVLFWDKWRKKARRNQLTQVHLKNGR